MKKLMIFCAVLALAATFMSCNKNNMGDKVAGTYNGYTIASSQYFNEMVSENEKLTVKSSGGNLAEIIFSSTEWGNFTIKEGEVSKVGKSYQIVGKGTCEVAVMGGGSTNTYECEIEAIVNNLQDAVFTFKVPSVMGGLTVVFTTGVPGN